MLRSYLCDYSDAYIVAKGTLDLSAAAGNKNDKAEKDVAFKNNVSFRSCISKINSTLISNAEDADIAMPIYNLLEYSQNNSIASGSLWNYYRDEIDNGKNNASDGKSFNYKSKILAKAPQRPGNEAYANQPPVPTSHVEVTISLKYLSNVYRYLDLLLMSYEIELDLSWTKDCLLIQHYNNITETNFMITGTNIYVPVVTLSIIDHIKFLQKYKART